jgi:Fe-S cluster assembly protein SufD
MPTGREEEWRFTPLDRLRPLLEDRPADGSVDIGWYSPAPATLESVGREDPRVGSALVPKDRVAAIALSRSEKAVALTVPRGEQADVHLDLRGAGGLAYGHLVVEVEPGGELTLILDHNGSSTYAGNIEYLVRDGASLTVVSVQDWERDAVHVGAHAAQLGRDARFKSVIVSLGGDLVRLSPTVTFAGPGGEAELLGLFFADAGQHLEHRMLVDHAVPHCRSRVTYKGALQGDDAHTVWIGDVMIRPTAIGTDTYELNRNLLLTDGARADSVPNLEIETGEVAKAGHASATGRFDDEQLFYLQARGIPAEVARRLVVRGFFAEVIAQIDDNALRGRLLAAIEDELERSLT